VCQLGGAAMMTEGLACPDAEMAKCEMVSDQGSLYYCKKEHL
jgi:hypothetical protein